MRIAKGNRGNEPLRINHYLNYRGIHPMVPPLDIFDKTTEDRVRTFQRSLYPFCLPQTGAVDEQTLSALSPFVAANLAVKVYKVPNAKWHLFDKPSFDVGSLGSPVALSEDVFTFKSAPRHSPAFTLAGNISANGLIPLDEHTKTYVKAELSLTCDFTAHNRRGRALDFELMAGVYYQPPSANYGYLTDLSKKLGKPGIIGAETEGTYGFKIGKTGMTANVGPNISLEYDLTKREWSPDVSLAFHLSGFGNWVQKTLQPHP